MSVGHCVVIEDAQNVIAYFVVPVNVCVLCITIVRKPRGNMLWSVVNVAAVS